MVWTSCTRSVRAQKASKHTHRNEIRSHDCYRFKAKGRNATITGKVIRTLIQYPQFPLACHVRVVAGRGHDYCAGIYNYTVDVCPSDRFTGRLDDFEPQYYPNVTDVFVGPCFVRRVTSQGPLVRLSLDYTVIEETFKLLGGFLLTPLRCVAVLYPENCPWTIAGRQIGANTEKLTAHDNLV